MKKRYPKPSDPGSDYSAGHVQAMLEWKHNEEQICRLAADLFARHDIPQAQAIAQAEAFAEAWEFGTWSLEVKSLGETQTEDVA